MKQSHTSPHSVKNWLFARRQCQEIVKIAWWRISIQYCVLLAVLIKFFYRDPVRSMKIFMTSDPTSSPEFGKCLQKSFRELLGKIKATAGKRCRSLIKSFCKMDPHFGPISCLFPCQSQVSAFLFLNQFALPHRKKHSERHYVV